MSRTDNQNLLHVLSEAAILTDARGFVRYVNPTYCRIFHAPAEEWQQRHAFFGEFETEQSDKSHFTSFVKSQRGDDAKVYLDWQASWMPDGGALYLGRDVTSNRKQDEALREMAATAEEASLSKMRFLATMSHEMRTPLNGILGMTGLLLDSDLDASQRTHAEAVHDSGTALLALINDILDYSKIEAGKLDLEETAFDPQSLVQSVCELLSPRAVHKDLEITSYVDPSVPTRLLGDEARLRQILLNLAGNGVKFTETGGVSVTVSAEPTKVPGQVFAKFEVRDTGIGIPAEAQRQIFEEFAQADSSHARKFEGTGLGLSIAQHIVEAMGGEISVESVEGEGSCFSFRVPLNTMTSRHEDSTPREINQTVIALVASSVLHESLERQLTAANVRKVEITDNAETAMRFLKRNSGATFLCDLAFAAQFGTRLAPQAANAIVLLSPVARGRLEAFRRAGFHGYLIKPIRQSSLVERITNRSMPNRNVQRLDSLTNKPAPGPRKLRILLAEDNQINAVLATAIVKRAGHHIDVAGNGKEAVENIANAPYDVILMDMHMPEMDGLDATRKIRSMGGAASETPIIALTANAMRSDRENCMNAGMDDFITKPFEPGDLLTLIHRWADGREGAEAEPAVGLAQEVSS